MKVPKFVRLRYSAVEMSVLSIAMGMPIHALRVMALRAFGATIHSEAVVYHGAQVRWARGLTVGGRTNIGDHAILDARGGLVIGKNVNMSTGVQIWTAQHDWKADNFDYIQAPVVVEDHVWIGPRVVVLPGSVIREGAVVAAGAVVKGEVAAFTLVGGVPAKKLGDRPRSIGYQLASPRTKQWWW